MAGKLFIVAKGNVTTFESLRRSVGHERDVTIIYDRRSDTWTDPSLARFWAHLRRKQGAPGAPAREERTSERRRRDEVAEEIRRQGWAVVRRDGEPAQANPPPPRVPGRSTAPPARPPARPPQRSVEPKRRGPTQPEVPPGSRRPTPRPDEAMPPIPGDVDLPIARDIIQRVMVGVFGVMLLLLAVACVVILLVL